MDDFDDNIFGEDEVFDCMVLDELGKEEGNKNNSNQGGGCLGTLIVFVGIISAMTFGVTKLIIL